MFSFKNYANTYTACAKVGVFSNILYKTLMHETIFKAFMYLCVYFTRISEKLKFLDKKA